MGKVFPNIIVTVTADKWFKEAGRLHFWGLAAQPRAAGQGRDGARGAGGEGVPARVPTCLQGWGGHRDTKLLPCRGGHRRAGSTSQGLSRGLRDRTYPYHYAPNLIVLFLS